MVNDNSWMFQCPVGEPKIMRLVPNPQLQRVLTVNHLLKSRFVFQRPKFLLFFLFNIQSGGVVCHRHFYVNSGFFVASTMRMARKCEFSWWSLGKPA